MVKANTIFGLKKTPLRGEDRILETVSKNRELKITDLERMGMAQCSRGAEGFENEGHSMGTGPGPPKIRRGARFV